MQPDIATLRREMRFLKLYAGSLTALVLVALLAAFRSSRSEDQVIRARGIVIVDAAGRERILIGAPIPEARNRVRTDTARVRQIWGPRFPKQYLTWYRSYRQGVNGILVLDENGFDRVALGDSVPDPNIGRRIGPSTGMVINDGEGFERSGYGLLRVNGTDRMVLGLDNDRGGEAVTLAVHDSGPVGVHVEDGPTSIWLGRAPAGLPGVLPNGSFSGLLVKEGAAVNRVTASPAP